MILDGILLIENGAVTDLENLEDLLGPLFILWLVLMVVFVIVDIVILVCVYKDAEARGMGGALWLIIVLVGNCLGCLIYLIVRGNHPK